MTDNLRDNVSKLLYEMCGIKGEINFLTLKLVIYGEMRPCIMTMHLLIRRFRKFVAKKRVLSRSSFIFQAYVTVLYRLKLRLSKTTYHFKNVLNVYKIVT